MGNKDNRGHNAVAGKQGFQPISIPADAPEAVNIDLPQNPYLESTNDVFANAEQAWNRTQEAETEVDPTTVFPDETVFRLKKIDDLGLKAANKLMKLREREVDAKSSFSYEGQQVAEKLAKRSALIHSAVLRAREELRHAKAFMEGDYIAPALPGYTSVIDADCLSSEADELVDLIEEKTEEGVDPETKYRIAQANAHIANARKAVTEALEEADQ